MFNNKFQDIEYEGLNLKIPYWFYNLNKNKLKPILDNLHSFLSDEALSKYHPDNSRNIKELEELEEFENKKEISDRLFKEEQELKNKQIKEWDDIKNENIIKIVYVNEIDSCDVENGFTFIFKDETIKELDRNEVVTEKYNIKSSFIKYFNENIDKIDIERTAIENRLSFLLQKHNRTKKGDFLLKNFSCDLYNLKLSFSVKSIKKVIKIKDNKIWFREISLIWNENNNCYGYESGNDIILLNEYEERNWKLVKKKI